ncbi:MAG: DHHA1 domain-containing protein, partial [Anaerolineae bacterium]|nr:DHHA1 domain-containing protein [Anaerolineae bacterium]
DAANAAGVEVIITDHHDLPDTLPAAQAIINPKRLPKHHPLRELPGVGVSFKLIEGLYEALDGNLDPTPLLDLVALGIVADVAHQTGDTRYLLQRGLTVLQTTDRLGLQALLEGTRLNTDRLTEEHISFWLAPRLNALGRLGDANLGVELLTTTDPVRARTLTLQLEALNDRRKLLVDQVVVQALGQIEDTPSLAERHNAIVLAADWHPGVIGVAANRLANQFNKPVILIALRPNGVGRGSGRSVAGCDIHHALKTQGHLLIRFGGHPMAAGLTINPENIAAFRRGLSAALADCGQTAKTGVRVDAVLDLAQISPDLLAVLERLAPFGAGNPRVQFGCRGLVLLDETVFGQTGANKRVTVADESGVTQEIIWWRGVSRPSPEGRFDLVFTVGKGPYDQVQVTWVDAEPWEPVPVAPAFEFIDCRSVSSEQLVVGNEEIIINDNPLVGTSVVWAEGDRPGHVAGLSRHRLERAENLVVWSAPPAAEVFGQALKRVQPKRVYLIGQPSAFDTLPAFVKQLMGLIKHALSHKEGEVDLEALAAALGHMMSTARLGIEWLVRQGKLSIFVDEDDGLLVLRPAQGAPNSEAARIESILRARLAETAAYRQFFRTAGLEALLPDFGMVP